MLRDQFPGYYQPTKDNLESIWRDATFIVDTNVLLNLYKFPQQARDDLFTVLEKLAGRLWIPFHVALEYQRNRVGVILEENEKFDSTVKQLEKAEAELDQAVARLELGKRGLGIDPSPLTTALKDAISKIRESVDKARKNQLSINHDDAVRNRLEKILGSNIGAPPESQAELDKSLDDAAARYEKRIPPGFLDHGKSKNPNEAKYIHDGIEYTAEYGDLIIWRQIIQHANNQDIKNLVFVTGDRKEDWWARKLGQTLGPLPELTQEICRLSSVKMFWMYTVDQFLEMASKALHTPIDKSSIKEVKDIENSTFKSDIINSLWKNITFDAQLASALDRQAISQTLELLNTIHAREKARQVTMYVASDGDLAKMKNSIDEWVVRQKRVDEWIEVNTNIWPAYRFKNQSANRGLHISTGEFHSHAYDLIKCSRAVESRDVDSATIIFTEMKPRSKILDSRFGDTREMEKNFPNVNCLYGFFDDQMNFSVKGVDN
ncbi:PIN domain-containing protein [Burkholderia sp. USMB20]|uniref:PIN domain-containing protein n=1 Tax=Burkholderia sp. USMB20 TaxID=1571773 RepID=UPI000B19AA0B|nr:PIN domain-containing protein [Burkholderia sp. USMB20]TGN96000.1 hypothetical protein PL79_020015 [Burkholderia sp. USMB20]